MSYSINDRKEDAAAPRPLVLCDFTFADASTLHVSTHSGAAYGGITYEACVDEQVIDRIASLSELGVDKVPSVTVRMADPAAAKYLSYERAAGKGFKGATVLMRLVLCDVETGEYSSDYEIPFVGRCDQASHDGKMLTVTASGRLNLGRYQLPITPIQFNCTWDNPATLAERTAAASPASNFYLCGETRDLTTAPPCSHTLDTCTQLARFGGCTYSVKNTGSGTSYLEGPKEWRNADTSAKYRDFWPLWLGGKCWLNDARCINIVGDGNYTRGEVAVGFGPVRVERVIVNGEELAYGVFGTDYHWSYVNDGQRDGTPCADAGFDSLGNSYGNETVILVRTPNSIWSASSAPSIQIFAGRGEGSRASISIATASGSGGGRILVEIGRASRVSDPGDGSTVTIEDCGFAAANGEWVLEYYAGGDGLLRYYLVGSSATGSGAGGYIRYAGSSFSASDAIPTPWLLKAVLGWCDVPETDLDTAAFTDAAEVCLANNYLSAMVLHDRRSAAELVRGLRQSIGATLRENADGKVTIRMDGPLAEQQPAAVSGSNSSTPITSQLRDGTTANGYPAYVFDESNSWDLQRLSQPTASLPNRVSFPFIDPENGYAVSTFTLVDSDDVARIGQEITGALQCQPEGIASKGFAEACATLGLNKILRGNPQGDSRGTDWWTWKTSFRACRVKVGDIVAHNDPLFGFTNQLIRVTEVSPAKNYKTLTFKGHFHADAWYLTGGVAVTPPPYVPPDPYSVDAEGYYIIPLVVP